MIVITGATGQLGHAIVEHLVNRLPANQLVASVRDPAKAASLKALGVDIRHGDFNEPDSLPTAFAGASQILLVSSNARATGGDPLVQHRAAIAAAKAVGAERIVYTSQMAASPISAFPPALDHATTETMLAQSGLAWTALRHGFYAASALQFIGDALTTGVIEAPADGKIAWTTHADLAEADAAILAEIVAGHGERYNGPTPPLTGSAALDFADLATIAGDLLGRPVERRTLTDDALRARFVARGAPERAAAMALGFYRASCDGEFDKHDPLLERLIGHRPTTMREVIAARLAARSA